MPEVLDFQPTITTKDPDSRWVALNNNGEVIAEGKTPDDVIEIAKKITDDFALHFVPVPGSTYIF